MQLKTARFQLPRPTCPARLLMRFRILRLACTAPLVPSTCPRKPRLLVLTCSDRLAPLRLYGIACKFWVSASPPQPRYLRPALNFKAQPKYLSPGTRSLKFQDCWSPARAVGLKPRYLNPKYLGPGGERHECRERSSGHKTQPVTSDPIKSHLSAASRQAKRRLHHIA